MEEKNIINVLQSEFISYASEILINNLPSIDGLLPVNRKVIWGLYKNAVTFDKPFIKMLRASSMAMIYYVFGDMPLTNAMKNMGNNSLNYFYLEPKGSFGDKRRRDGVGASPRYIECKLSKYSSSMLDNINKNNVPMKMNFDNTENEPIILPSIMPNILINMSQSIAVGESSKIPSHNLNEVCDSFISYIKTNEIKKSISLLNGLDFNTGGKIIYNEEIFNKIYTTGKGSFTLTGDCIYDEKENKISIIEVPYETYIEDIDDKIRNCYEKGIFKEIIDIHDGTDKDGIRLDIYLKKNTDIKQFIKKLRKYTSYESKFSCNFTILDLDGKTPRLMSLEDIIQKWLQHRYNCINKEIEYDINKLNVDLNKLYGLQIILNYLDAAIKLIRESKSEKTATESLIKYFKLNSEQAEYISTIKLININKEWMFKKVENIKKLEIDLKELKNKQNNKKYIDEIIIEQLEYCKNTYGQPRKTEIIYEDSIPEVKDDIFIDEFSTYVILTNENYIKKLLKKSDNIKLKDTDSIIYQSYSSNKSTLLLFSNQGNCYKIYEHELQECKPSELGVYLRTLLNLSKDEKITSMVTTKDYSEQIIEVFENGKIAKINLSSFKTEQKRSQLKNAINIQSPLVKMFTITKDIDIVLKSSLDKVLITNTSIISSKDSKSTQGNIVMKSKNDSIVVFSELLSDVNTELIEDVDYYKGTTGIGSYLKKTDKIELNIFDK